MSRSSSSKPTVRRTVVVDETAYKAIRYHAISTGTTAQQVMRDAIEAKAATLKKR